MVIIIAGLVAKKTKRLSMNNIGAITFIYDVVNDIFATFKFSFARIYLLCSITYIIAKHYNYKFGLINYQIL